MKKFEVEFELIQIKEVAVWADSFAEAEERAKKMKLDDVEEGETNDWELRVIGVRRNKELRMYK